MLIIVLLDSTVILELSEALKSHLTVVFIPFFS